MRTKNAGHREAQRKFKATKCIVCGSTKNLERHHKDGNPNNNAPSNVAVLCQKHHIKIHQELGDRVSVQPAVCVVCNKKFQPKRTRNSTVCSTACRSRHGKMNADKRWAGRKTKKKCAFCGREFTFKRPREMTCSRSCGNKLAWKKRTGGKNR